MRRCLQRTLFPICVLYCAVLCVCVCVCVCVRACACVYMCRIRNSMYRGVSVYIEECLCSRQHHLLRPLIIVACNVKFVCSFESGNLTQWSLFTECTLGW